MNAFNLCSNRECPSSDAPLLGSTSKVGPKGLCPENGPKISALRI